MGDLLPEEPGKSAHGMGSPFREKAQRLVRRADQWLLRYFERPAPHHAATRLLRALLLVEAPIRWLDKPVAMLLAGIQVRERKRREKHLEKHR
ncbi:hypothetical protein AB4090_14070 [Acidithiobacillus sp. IBUN Pt1247-S3]|uniref:hypothetical protein n=1 Tax=Acidithiobacillus sp. IBUN Pt1247-S3 TaxID=3166642 RepID=UPI0034E5ECF2